jgi:DegV family protein with EDD domain
VTVAVVCDDSADVGELLDAYGVRVVAVPVTDGGTAAPAPGALLAALRAAAADGVRGAVIVTLAAALSGTHNAARIAAGMAEVPCEVIDSGTAAGAHALVVLAAARAAADGADIWAVAAAARTAAAEVRLVGTLRSVDGLVASGRLSAPLAGVARGLHVRPLFELRDGAVRPLRPALSAAAAGDRLLSLWRRDNGRSAEVVIQHTDEAAAAAGLAAAMSADGRHSVVVAPFGPALLAVTGPGVLGVAWRR